MYVSIHIAYQAAYRTLQAVHGGGTDGALVNVMDILRVYHSTLDLEVIHFSSILSTVLCLVAKKFVYGAPSLTSRMVPWVMNTNLKHILQSTLKYIAGAHLSISAYILPQSRFIWTQEVNETPIKQR